MHRKTESAAKVFERRLIGAMLCAMFGVGAGSTVLLLSHLQVI